MVADNVGDVGRHRNLLPEIACLRNERGEHEHADRNERPDDDEIDRAFSYLLEVHLNPTNRQRARATTFVAAVVAALISALNVFLLITTFWG